MKAMNKLLFIMLIRRDDKGNTIGVYDLGCLISCDFFYSGTRHDKNLKDSSFESHLIGPIYRTNEKG